MPNQPPSNTGMYGAFFPVDASGGDPYGLSGLGGTRGGFLVDSDPVDGVPSPSKDSVGRIEPLNWRYSDLGKRDGAGNEDRRLEIQMVVDYPGPHGTGSAPYGQPEYYTPLNRGTRVIDSAGRVTVRSTMERVIDDETQRYAMALTCRSIGQEIASVPQPPPPEPPPEGTTVIGRVETGGGTAPRVDPTTGTHAQGAQGGTSARPPSPPLNPNGNVQPSGHARGYMWSEAGHIGLWGTLVVPEGASGSYFKGTEGTPIGPLPLRADAQVSMDPTHVGGILYAADDVADESEGDGELRKGWMYFDSSMANLFTALGLETGKWRPCVRVDGRIPPSRVPPEGIDPSVNAGNPGGGGGGGDPEEEDEEEEEPPETGQPKPPKKPGNPPPPVGGGGGEDGDETPETAPPVGSTPCTGPGEGSGKTAERGAGTETGAGVQGGDATRQRDSAGGGVSNPESQARDFSRTAPCPNQTAGRNVSEIPGPRGGEGAAIDLADGRSITRGYPSVQRGEAGVVALGGVDPGLNGGQPDRPEFPPFVPSEPPIPDEEQPPSTNPFRNPDGSVRNYQRRRTHRGGPGIESLQLGLPPPSHGGLGLPLGQLGIGGQGTANDRARAAGIQAQLGAARGSGNSARVENLDAQLQRLQLRIEQRERRGNSGFLTFEPPLGGDRGIPRGSGERFDAAQPRGRIQLGIQGAQSPAGFLQFEEAGPPVSRAVRAQRNLEARQRRDRQEKARIAELQAGAEEADADGRGRLAERMRVAARRIADRQKARADNRAARAAYEKAKEEERAKRAFDRTERDIRRRRRRAEKRAERANSGGGGSSGGGSGSGGNSGGSSGGGRAEGSFVVPMGGDNAGASDIASSGAFEQFGDYNAANFPIGQAGTPRGGRTIEDQLILLTAKAQAWNTVLMSFFGGPAVFGGSVAVRSQNAPGKGATPNAIGSHVTAGAGESITLGRGGSEALVITSVLQADAGGQIRADTGGAVEIRREQRGEGSVTDTRPLLLLDNKGAPCDSGPKDDADLISTPSGDFRVTGDGEVVARSVHVSVPQGDNRTTTQRYGPRQNVIEVGRIPGIHSAFSGGRAPETMDVLFSINGVSGVARDAVGIEVGTDDDGESPTTGHRLISTGADMLARAADGSEITLGSGDVTGPGSSTDNAIVRFDGTAGDTVQGSAGIIDDVGDLTGLTINGAVVGSTDSVPTTGVQPGSDFCGQRPGLRLTYDWSTPTKLSDPIVLPVTGGRDGEWSVNGDLLSVACDGSPFFRTYSLIGNSIVSASAYTPQLPGSSANGVSMSPDGQVHAVVLDSSPYVEYRQIIK